MEMASMVQLLRLIPVPLVQLSLAQLQTGSEALNELFRPARLFKVFMLKNLYLCLCLPYSAAYVWEGMKGVLALEYLRYADIHIFEI
jgi:hypothetical protein